MLDTSKSVVTGCCATMRYVIVVSPRKIGGHNNDVVRPCRDVGVSRFILLIWAGGLKKENHAMLGLTLVSIFFVKKKKIKQKTNLLLCYNIQELVLGLTEYLFCFAQRRCLEHLQSSRR